MRLRRVIGLALALALVVGVAGAAFAAATTILINNTDGNYVPIANVVLDVGGTTIDQTASDTSAGNRTNPANKTATAVNLISLVVDDGGTDVTIVPFNTTGTDVTLVGLTNQAGVGVAPSGPALSDGAVAFKAAAETLVFGNLNLHNYMYFDGFAPGQTYDGTVQYKVMYGTPLSATDYIVVMERWGNSHLELKPLDADGNVIAGTNTLHFGKALWDSNPVFDWNTGYAHNSYEKDQSYWLMVAKVDKLFEGTEVSPAAVYGFAVENRGEADHKFFTFKVPRECHTRSQGYWKTHGTMWPEYGCHEGSYDAFFLSGKSWMGVMWSAPKKGDAYYVLAHQFIAAHLNMLSNEYCSVPAQVLSAYDSAAEYFHTGTPGVLTGGRLSTPNKALRQDVLNWAEVLENWNCGY